MSEVTNVEIAKILEVLLNEDKVKAPDPDLLYSSLRIAQVISNDEIRHIKEPKERLARLSLLIDRITEKGEKAYIAFYEILYRDNYVPAIQAMQKRMTELDIVLSGNQLHKVIRKSSSSQAISPGEHVLTRRSSIRRQTSNDHANEIPKEIQQNIELQIQLRDSRDENQRLYSEISELEQENDEMRSKLEKETEVSTKLKEENADLQSAAIDLGQKNEFLTKEIAELKSKAQEAKLKCASLEAQNIQWKTKADEEANKNQLLEKECAENRIKIEETEKKVLELEAQLKEEEEKTETGSETREEESEEQRKQKEIKEVKLKAVKALEASSIENVTEFLEDFLKIWQLWQEEHSEEEEKEIWLFRHVFTLWDPFYRCFAFKMASEFASGNEMKLYFAAFKTAHRSISLLLQDMLGEMWRLLKEQAIEACKIIFDKGSPTKTLENAQLISTASIGVALYFIHYFQRQGMSTNLLQLSILLKKERDAFQTEGENQNKAVEEILSSFVIPCATAKLKSDRFQAFLTQLKAFQAAADPSELDFERLLEIPESEKMEQFVSRANVLKEGCLKKSCEEHNQLTNCISCMEMWKRERDVAWVNLLLIALAELEDDPEWISLRETEDVIGIASKITSSNSTLEGLEQELETRMKEHVKKRRQLYSNARINSATRIHAEAFWSMVKSGAIKAKKRSSVNSTFQLSHTRILEEIGKMKEAVDRIKEEDLPKQLRSDRRRLETECSNANTTVDSNQLEDFDDSMSNASLSNTQSPPLARTFDGYHTITIEQLKNQVPIGSSSSGSGQVYMYTHIATEKEMVVKTIDSKVESVPKAVSKWVRESQNKKEWLCENIVPVLGFMRMDLQGYAMVTEPMMKAMNSFLNETNNLNIPEFFLRKASREVLKGLAFLVEKGFSHAHIQLSDIMLGYDGNFKIGNLLYLKSFGSLIQVGSQDENIFYRPIEFRHAPLKYSPVSDVRATGLSMLELITGKKAKSFASGPLSYGKIATLLFDQDSAEPDQTESIYTDGLLEFLELCLVSEEDRLEPKLLLHFSWTQEHSGETGEDILKFYNSIM